MNRSENDSGAWAIRLLWIVAFATFTVGLAATCEADCREGLASRLVDHDSGGFVITADDMECLVLSLEQGDRYRERVGLLQERLRLSDERHASMIAATSHGTEAIATLQEALAESVRLRMLAEDRAESWWRQPIVWFTVGILVTVGAGVGLVLLK